MTKTDWSTERTHREGGRRGCLVEITSEFGSVWRQVISPLLFYVQHIMVVVSPSDGGGGIRGKWKWRGWGGSVRQRKGGNGGWEKLMKNWDKDSLVEVDLWEWERFLVTRGERQWRKGGTFRKWLSNTNLLVLLTSLFLRDCVRSTWGTLADMLEWIISSIGFRCVNNNEYCIFHNSNSTKD